MRNLRRIRPPLRLSCSGGSVVFLRLTSTLSNRLAERKKSIHEIHKPGGELDYFRPELAVRGISYPIKNPE